jgi:type I restriction-modification system DNA methylase subunit
MSPFEKKQKSTKKLILTSQISQVAQSNTTNFTTDTTTDINSTRMAVSNGITNKEALKDKIHDIHNYLRNHGAGYGMNALKVFNILYGLKKIEDKGLHESVGLTEESRFSNLLNLANKNKDEEIAILVLGGVLTSIHRSKIKYLLFYEIPRNIKGSVFAHLIKEINLVAQIEVTCNVLLSGKIYEYFIGRDESAISELGAYFTDRHIVDYIYDKLNPKICENGVIPSMIDMFGGSGGFTTGYIDKLNKKYPELVNWGTEINKIYHYDMNEDVIKSAGLEFFCLTGVLPNMSNLKYKNSFTDEFIDEATNTTKKYHYVITNPPYGGDKSKKTEAQKKNEKIKEYIKKELLTITDEDVKKQRHLQIKKIEANEKQEKRDNDKSKVSVSMCSGRIQKFSNDNALSGNDKEACSLMLMMDLLEVDGTSIGVLKEGVFFNSAYKNLRKCLVENFNVREVISVPQDQFENTSTKTSIIIFDNTEEKTTKIRFSELSVDKYEEDVYEDINGNIYLTENKGDIKGLGETIVSVASAAELLKHKSFSLNGNDYNNDKLEVSEEYELQKIGDLCEFQPKSKRSASFAVPEGIYNFYTSSAKVKKCETADYDSESIVIGTGGNSCIHHTNEKFSCSADTLILKPHKLRVSCQYIHYGLLSVWENLINEMHGSTIKHITKEMLTKFEIRVPKNEKKIQEWVDKISKPYNEKKEKQAEVEELEIDIQNRIKEITENDECDEIEFDKILKHVPKINKYKASDGASNGLYHFYTSSQDKILYRNDYEFEDSHILIGRGGNVSIHLASKFSVSHDDVYVIKLFDCSYDLRYVFNYLKTNINLISSSFKGSTIKHSSKEGLSKIMIKIPKNKKMITDMDSMFHEVQKLQKEIKNADELYKQYIQELGNEAKQSDIIANNEKTNVVIIEQVEEPIVKIRKIKKKSTV